MKYVDNFDFFFLICQNDIHVWLLCLQAMCEVRVKFSLVIDYNRVIDSRDRFDRMLIDELSRALDISSSRLKVDEVVLPGKRINPISESSLETNVDLTIVFVDIQPLDANLAAFDAAIEILDEANDLTEQPESSVSETAKSSYSSDSDVSETSGFETESVQVDLVSTIAHEEFDHVQLLLHQSDDESVTAFHYVSSDDILDVNRISTHQTSPDSRVAVQIDQPGSPFLDPGSPFIENPLFSRDVPTSADQHRSSDQSLSDDVRSVSGSDTVTKKCDRTGSNCLPISAPFEKTAIEIVASVRPNSRSCLSKTRIVIGFSFVCFISAPFDGCGC
jgi:hypothetical protein